jgi:predicted RNA binding protein YcfA (HicA-like mRNA interferase family)
VKLPRDLSGTTLAKALSHMGYTVTRQSGSHIRLTTNVDGIHHVTIPSHNPLHIGTIHSILKDVADHFHISRDDLLR